MLNHASHSLCVTGAAENSSCSLAARSTGTSTQIGLRLVRSASGQQNGHSVTSGQTLNGESVTTRSFQLRLSPRSPQGNPTKWGRQLPGALVAALVGSCKRGSWLSPARAAAPPRPPVLGTRLEPCCWLLAAPARSGSPRPPRR